MRTIFAGLVIISLSTGQDFLLMDFPVIIQKVQADDLNPRVVSVHNSLATTWESMSDGNPRNCMDQAEINRMVERGVISLTGCATSAEAWSSLIPYQSGDDVVLKMNFNNIWRLDNFEGDSAMNAYPQVANAVIDGLVSIGIPSDKIWIVDPSRAINDAFRAGITDPDIQYATTSSVEDIGGRPNVHHTDYVAWDSPYASMSIGADGTEMYIKPAEIFVEAEHIINIPQLKGHSDTPDDPARDKANITLGLKNHFGSVLIRRQNEGWVDAHNYFYITGSLYSPECNPLADISLNPVFRDKTRLTIGDGLMGHPYNNTHSPLPWVTFDNRPPETLFFSQDPVAVDSVMFDYLNRECTAIGAFRRVDDILQYAANAGLGVCDHWNNDTDRQYSLIDYGEINLDGDGISYPVAVFEPDPDHGLFPLSVNFNGTASYDHDGSIQSYEWDFTNDDTIDAAGSIVSHVYSQPGEYTASLTVTDNDEYSGKAFRVITVSVPDEPALMTIAVDPQTAEIIQGETQTFTAEGKDQYRDTYIINPIWSVSGGGTINADGIFIADLLVEGPFTVTASEGQISGTAEVTIVSGDDPGTNPETEEGIPKETKIQVFNNILKTGTSQTLIRCDMKEPGKLEVTIYDSKGREIKTVFNGYHDAGSPAFPWNGTDESGNSVGSGIYIVHMIMGSCTETKKIAVIK
ncbi:MAG: PKD domain-containing protein [Parcubacteria group bacterium]